VKARTHPLTLGYACAGVCYETLQNFLEMNLPKSKSVKKCTYSLGVSDSKIGTAIQVRMVLGAAASGTCVPLCNWSLWAPVDTEG
jgi:hypothetical protein